MWRGSESANLRIWRPSVRTLASQWPLKNIASHLLNLKLDFQEKVARSYSPAPRRNAVQFESALTGQSTCAPVGRFKCPTAPIAPADTSQSWIIPFWIWQITQWSLSPVSVLIQMRYVFVFQIKKPMVNKNIILFQNKKSLYFCGW